MTASSQALWCQPADRGGPSSRFALAQCRQQNEGTCNVAEGTTPGLVACSGRTTDGVTTVLEEPHTCNIITSPSLSLFFFFFFGGGGGGGGRYGLHTVLEDPSM